MNHEILRSFATPFLLVDAVRAGEKYLALRSAFAKRFRRVEIGLSYKTAYVPALFKSLHAMGALAEVVSGAEYELAIRLGVEPDRIVFNGPGKSRDELSRALTAGSTVNLDSIAEVDFVVDIGKDEPDLFVGLRVALPLMEQRGPRTLSRFGFSLEDGELAEAVQRLRGAGVSIRGLHAHLTSRQRSLDYYRELVRELTRAADLTGRDGLEYLDVGGGYGYSPAELPFLSFPSFGDYAEVLRDELESGFGALDDARLIIEPGIALFGDVVSLYCRVLALKKRGQKTICVVDTTAQLVKPTKHDLNLPTIALDDEFGARRDAPEPVDIVGYTCLEDDVIARDIELPRIRIGDVLCISNLGAYTFAFKPPFIRGLPAFLLWNGSTVRAIRRCDDFEDLFGAHEL
jgi:diaminopimelate decarboxylase